GPAKSTADHSFVPVYFATASDVQAQKLDVTTASGVATMGAVSNWPAVTVAGPRALALAGKALYIGGDSALRGVGAVKDADTGDKEPDPKAFEKTPDGTVDALAVDGDRLLAGGQFGKVGDAVRDRLAAFALADSALAGWDPRVA